MGKLTQIQKAIALPLIGEVWAWVFFVGAIAADIEQSQANGGYGTFSDAVQVHIATYLYLLAIAGFSFAAVAGQRIAISSRAELGEGHSLARAAHRLGNFAVVLGLAFGVIFAFSSFMMGFGFGVGGQALIIKLLNVYLPIVLSTALVVYVILRAFVFSSATIVEGKKVKRGLTEAQKALALGYAVPILATAFAIILGLAVFDATRTNLDVWVWVLIQVIVVGGVVQGTRFAAKAKAGKVKPPRERKALAAGAAMLNYVLSVVFAVVVSIMAFTYGAGAINKLEVYATYDQNGNVLKPSYLRAVSVDWAINDFLPALVLLGVAVVGVYWTMNARNAEPKAESAEISA